METEKQKKTEQRNEMVSYRVFKKKEDVNTIDREDEFRKNISDSSREDVSAKKALLRDSDNHVRQEAYQKKEEERESWAEQAKKAFRQEEQKKSVQKKDRTENESVETESDEIEIYENVPEEGIENMFSDSPTEPFFTGNSKEDDEEDVEKTRRLRLKKELEESRKNQIKKNKILSSDSTAASSVQNPMVQEQGKTSLAKVASADRQPGIRIHNADAVREQGLHVMDELDAIHIKKEREDSTFSEDERYTRFARKDARENKNAKGSRKKFSEKFEEGMHHIVDHTGGVYKVMANTANPNSTNASESLNSMADLAMLAGEDAGKVSRKAVKATAKIVKKRVKIHKQKKEDMAAMYKESASTETHEHEKEVASVHNKAKSKELADGRKNSISGFNEFDKEEEKKEPGFSLRIWNTKDSGEFDSGMNLQTSIVRKNHIIVPEREKETLGRQANTVTVAGFTESVAKTAKVKDTEDKKKKGNSHEEEREHRRKKMISREKVKFAITQIAGDKYNGADTTSGLGEYYGNKVKNKAKNIAADAGRKLLKVTKSVFKSILSAAAPFLAPVLIMFLLIFLFFGSFGGTIGMIKWTAVIVMDDADQTTVDKSDPNYITNLVKLSYDSFHQEAEQKASGPDDELVYASSNPNYYDVIWAYLTYYEETNKEKCLIIDENGEFDCLSALFNEMYSYTVEDCTTVEKSRTIHYKKVTITEITFDEWYHRHQNSLTKGQKESYTAIKELLEEEMFSQYNSDYVGNMDVSVFSDKAMAIWSFLKNMGCTDEGAAGMLGNLAAETGDTFDPNCGAGNSFQGIVQWGGGRFTGLTDYAKKKGTEWNDFQTQLEYMAKELKGSNYNNVYNMMKKTDDVSYATDYIALYYEGCVGQLGDWAYSKVQPGQALQGLNTRWDYAEKYYQLFHGQSIGGIIMPAGTTELRKATVHYALSCVGKIPYYFGGQATSPDFNSQAFGTVCAPDEYGANLKGLDCSHFVDFVYWNTLNNDLGNGNTAALWAASTQISFSELKPGDLAFLAIPGTTAGVNHVGIYAGTNASGQPLYIHENGAADNVSCDTVSYWTVYARLKVVAENDKKVEKNGEKTKPVVTPAPKPSNTPKPTDALKPTETVRPTSKPTSTPKPTAKPKPSESTWIDGEDDGGKEDTGGGDEQIFW